MACQSPRCWVFFPTKLHISSTSTSSTLLSLFSDIDLLVLFDDDRPSRELTRAVYQQIKAREAVDILAYSRQAMAALQERPFFRHILSYGKVLYEGP